MADEVAEQVQKQIIDGELKEGDKLPIEAELMKEFGVGRSSIREAVKKLENMGYLKVQQGKGLLSQPRHYPKNLWNNA